MKKRKGEARRVRRKAMATRRLLKAMKRAREVQWEVNMAGRGRGGVFGSWQAAWLRVALPLVSSPHKTTFAFHTSYMDNRAWATTTGLVRIREDALLELIPKEKFGAFCYGRREEFYGE